jgi:hypothetical protein
MFVKSVIQKLLPYILSTCSVTIFATAFLKVYVVYPIVHGVTFFVTILHKL